MPKKPRPPRKSPVKPESLLTVFLPSSQPAMLLSGKKKHRVLRWRLAARRAGTRAERRSQVPNQRIRRVFPRADRTRRRRDDGNRASIAHAHVDATAVY